jgi:NADPH-dependent 2,4-dienoyl-CoA reductase/sulfur reductase-like enzyme
MPERKRILIVGGVAGGASAATRARRLSEDAEIVLFERGPDVSFANCGLPYHVGGAIRDRKRLLVQTPEGLYARYEIDVRVNTEVVAIDRQAREVVARDLRGGREYRQPYDALVLSPGCRRRGRRQAHRRSCRRDPRGDDRLRSRRSRTLLRASIR